MITTIAINVWGLCMNHKNWSHNYFYQNYRTFLPRAHLPKKMTVFKVVKGNRLLYSIYSRHTSPSTCYQWVTLSPIILWSIMQFCQLMPVLWRKHVVEDDILFTKTSGGKRVKKQCPRNFYFCLLSQILS